MKLSELITVIYDEVVIYTAKKNGEEYLDLYKGKTSNIPHDMLNMNVRSIGTIGKRIDIKVE